MPSLRYPVLLSRSSVSVISNANLVLSTAIQLDTPSVHLRRIKLTTLSVDDRRAAAKIIYVKCSGERFGGTPLFLRIIRIPLKQRVVQLEGSSHAETGLIRSVVLYPLPP